MNDLPTLKTALLDLLYETHDTDLKLIALDVDAQIPLHRRPELFQVRGLPFRLSPPFPFFPGRAFQTVRLRRRTPEGLKIGRTVFFRSQVLGLLFRIQGSGTGIRIGIGYREWHGRLFGEYPIRICRYPIQGGGFAVITDIAECL